MTLPDIYDRVRIRNGFLTLAQMVQLCENGNDIFDPFSTLISAHAKIGKGNIFYPGVIIIGTSNHAMEIADSNIFHSNTLIESSSGPVYIGSENQFGEGGVTIKANREGSIIKIENKGRYLGGAAVFGSTFLGHGSQILGAITADNCHLEQGDSWREPSPDARGGLLKGHGLAKDLTVGTGLVINGSGNFKDSLIEPQSNYHKIVKQSQ
ncbi:MAG: hypothetical protein P4L95_19375 [Rouxiella aceris]|uniref:hypothetical protein n=1 Tax=Rouxiella aceris TaxID=2703884 RepID=UPI002845B6A4|nr:hypothetical protein [Rouxiella aceris]MDR3434026.1 hypothetical protein [Rouxiella aceris]